MMQFMSAWWPLIYAGCFAATLSTALTNLLSVPRLIQALGVDKIYPGLIFFSKGYGKYGEPYRGYVLTFVVSTAFLLIGKHKRKFKWWYIYNTYNFLSEIKWHSSTDLKFLPGILCLDQFLYVPRSFDQTFRLETYFQSKWIIFLFFQEKW